VVTNVKNLVLQVMWIVGLPKYVTYEDFFPYILLMWASR